VVREVTERVAARVVARVVMTEIEKKEVDTIEVVMAEDSVDEASQADMVGARVMEEEMMGARAAAGTVWAKVEVVKWAARRSPHRCSPAADQEDDEKRCR
jgi:hypothetical protein